MTTSHKNKKASLPGATGVFRVATECGYGPTKVSESLFAKEGKRLVGGLVLAMLLLTSCYKLISTSAPKIAEAGSTIEVSFTVVDDGSSTQNFVTDWSYAGIRVPEGWEVNVPKGAHQQFAENWVYYSDGSKVNSQHNMVACDKLTEFCNAAFKKSKYTWHGFQSQKKVPKNISACWRNGCDSIRITFLVTIPEDAKPGKYTIDFVGGDEEDDAGINKYNTCTDAKDSRIFHVGTVNGSLVENKATNLACQIEVTESATNVKSAISSEVTINGKGIYTLDGKKVRSKKNTAGLPHGVYYIDGKKVIL